MPLETSLNRWKKDPTIADNIVEWRVIPAREARSVPLPADLHPVLAEALRAQGIAALYSHQQLSWLHALRGKNIVVITGTASGKTLCYNLPVLHTLLTEPAARALYLFPTKALAQDQMSVLNNFEFRNSNFEIEAGIYDGDTPGHVRSGVRKNARILLSNPDMLHTGILPRHTAWADFFANLRFVVLDEMHTYRGVFGSHVANVLRRLKRVARRYGAKPQFILTSATIGNPGELAERLIEETVQVVDDDGSAHGPKHFVVYNPPVVDEKLGLRRSTLGESVRLAADLLAANVQTILFGQSRRGVELMVRSLREAAGEAAHAASGLENGAIRGYRSGYLPGQRREIEAGLRSRAVRAVAATTALELGIDIGGMGAALLAGYPGTVAATWQQAGRAGRGAEPALAVLVAGANPLDQFLARHPEYFFGRSPEHGLINPDHVLILLAHLRCAVYEQPFGAGESFGKLDRPTVQEFLDYLTGEGVLRRTGNQYYWISEQFPAQAVSLRSASPASVTLNAEGRTIGVVDFSSAAWMVHPGAVYLHEGQSFLVESLELEEGRAQLKAAELDYYTEPHIESTVSLQNTLAEAAAPGGSKAFGEIVVASQVMGYRKVKWITREHLGLEALDMQPERLQTTGYWLALGSETIERLQAEGLWTNTPNDYGPGWQRLAAAVRARDGYLCRGCGAPERERAHDVHHITPFRTFASTEQANRMDNLATLCPACHRRAEAGVRVRSGLAGLAFALGNLAPLFLMCDVRDLGVHSDPESPLAGGQPVVVIYDRIPAGIGFSERLYALHEELMARARELVSGCACEDGCPSCVGPGGEGIAALTGGRREALAILDALNV